MAEVLIAEMAPLYAKYDVFVTAAPGPAPRLDSWRTINFWQKASLTTPFNVTGGPALAQCIGYTPDGLPLSMQVVGRPFDDATVLHVAHAYESATPWRRADRRSRQTLNSPPHFRPSPSQRSPRSAQLDATKSLRSAAGLG